MQASDQVLSELMRVNVFDVETTPQRFDGAIRTLESWALDANGRRYVSTCPVYTLMMCREHPDVMRAINQADMVAADGMPVVWMQRKLGAAQAERVYGPDVMQTLCAHGNPSIRHYFWGGLPGVPEKLADTLRLQNPHIQIAGMHSPPVRPVATSPDPDVVERINCAGTSIVWVGLESPKHAGW